MIARTVTLPMAEVLAQAPEVSPWWDQTDIGDLVVRTLDDLGIADRMWVALHILGPTPTERLLIVGMSRRGWIGFWTRDEMMAVSSLSYDAVSRAALGLERKKIIRVNRDFLPAGSVTFLVTFSGQHIRRGYDRATGAIAETANAATQTDGPVVHAVSELGTAGDPHPASRRGKPAEVHPAGGEPHNSSITPAVSSPETAIAETAIAETAGRQSVSSYLSLGKELENNTDRLTDGRLGAFAETAIAETANAETAGRQLVSSYLSLGKELENNTDRLTDGRPGAFAETAIAETANAPPAWYEVFSQLVSVFPYRLRCPRWKEMRGMAVPEDAASGYQVLREACAMFLDQYAHQGAKRVGRVKGAVRAIYLDGLISWARGHSGSWQAWYENAAWMNVSNEWLPEPAPDEPDPQEPQFAFTDAVDADPAAVELWRAVLDDLQLQLPRPTFETWLRPTQGIAFAQGADGASTLIVEAPTPFAVEWLERRMFHALQRSLEKCPGPPVELRLQVRKANPTYGEDRHE